MALIRYQNISRKDDQYFSNGFQSIEIKKIIKKSWQTHTIKFIYKLFLQ
jgi:hypothetical protein